MKPTDPFAFRVVSPREEAMRQYAQEFDRLARDAEAVRLPIARDEILSPAQAATIARVAWLAEDSKAPSPNPPWCLCATCQRYLFAVRWQRLVGS